MEIDFLSSSQAQTIQEIADTSQDRITKQNAQILLLLNQETIPEHLSGQFDLAVEEIESLYQSFLERGMDIFPGTAQPVEAASRDVAPPEGLVSKFIKAKTPGVHSEDEMSEAGRKTLAFHFARMVKNEPGTRLGEDIEALHDMRVSTRRMRVALELFSPFFKKKALKPHLNGLRDTGRALGSVRDLDVFSEELSIYLEKLPQEEHPGFDVFLARWQEKHHKAQSKMIRFLDSDRYQSFTQQFGQFLDTPGKGARRPKTILPTRVRDIAPIMVYERLAAVRAHEQALGNATIEELHAVRIQLKKLRYLVEFFGDVLGPENKEVIRVIKSLQDHLGKLNDADVACRILNEFVAGLEHEQASLPIYERVNPEPILTYLAAKYDERHHLVAGFPGVWQTIMERDFTENLARAISAI